MSNSKKNKFLKILLPAVLLIWGYVGYVLYDAFNTDNVSSSGVSISNQYKKPEIQPKEFFELLPIENDPFLGTTHRKPAGSINRAVSKAEKRIVWPDIQYEGIVSGGAVTIYMISINGQQYLFKKGDNIENVELIRANSNNVSLIYEGSTKQFPLM